MFDCALDGVFLSGLDERVQVLDIRQEAPKLRAATAVSAQPLLRESLTVRIDFALPEEAPVRRGEVLSSINAWAMRGGMLSCSDRPGQRLAVVCTGLCAPSAEDWTEKLTLTFRSARAPYWEEALPVTASGSGPLTLTVPGTAEVAPVDADILNSTEETVDTVLVHTGDTQMIFEGLTFAPGELLRISGSGGPLRAMLNGESVLHLRTADSADLLLVRCGADNTVLASAETPLTASFSVRGRYA